jgi:hypothetical protein
MQTRIRLFVLLLWVAGFGGAWSAREWMRHAHVVMNQATQLLGCGVLVAAIFLLRCNQRSFSAPKSPSPASISD